MEIIMYNCLSPIIGITCYLVGKQWEPNPSLLQKKIMQIMPLAISMQATLYRQEGMEQTTSLIKTLSTPLFTYMPTSSIEQNIYLGYVIAQKFFADQSQKIFSLSGAFNVIENILLFKLTRNFLPNPLISIVAYQFLRICKQQKQNIHIEIELP